MTKQPELGDIWVWDRNHDYPYLILALVENGEIGEYTCMCLKDGKIKSMFFAHVMDYWERVA